MGQGGAVGEAAGEGVGGLVGAALVGEGADQADALGLRRSHRVAQHQQPGGVAEADHAGQQIRRAHVAAGEADPGEEEGEAGAGVGDPEVGGQGEDRAGARRHPVDRGDHGERALPYRPHHLAGHPVEVEKPGRVHGEGRADDLVDVAAGAEAAPLAGQHQGAYGPLAGQLGKEIAQVGVGAEGERVELVGAGEGDGGDAVGHIEAHMLPAGGAGGGAGEGTHEGGLLGRARRCSVRSAR
ncbi:hypothetical protein SHKM778_26790 [Streptomyces sp. KM77-8]|uniref:Uncharacterized protein n=1 Tax=Streptomyces haneummycinicus TaxID=3074435 RepID=A0AAT9HG65_9ACTN